jgi:glc operon protein GlcG
MSKVSRVTQALGVVLLAAFAAQAPAQQPPPYGPDINIETAKKAAAAAVAECTNNKWKMAVAVVDTHGSLVYFERINDTQIASVRIAQDKAIAAATYRRPTRVWEDAMAKGRIAVVTLAGVVASPGGVPIVNGGKVIGAIGASGGTGDQDEQCSKAGAEAVK